jgi:hypothetical protein
MAVAVRLTGKLPAEIEGKFDSVVRLDKEFETFETHSARMAGKMGGIRART